MEDQSIKSKHSEKSRKWLIRVANYRIFGPLTDQEMVQRIQQGKFKKEDEVCPANGDWFYLNQSEELKKYFKNSAFWWWKKMIWLVIGLFSVEFIFSRIWVDKPDVF